MSSWSMLTGHSVTQARQLVQAPELVLGEVVVEQDVVERRLAAIGLEHDRSTARHIELTGQQWCLLHQATARIHDDLARAERLARDVRRTCCGAATALRAAVAVEQVLPREVIDVTGAELLHLGLEVHRTHHADLARAAGVAEPDIDQRADDVQVLGVRQEVEEAEDQQRVQPEASHRVRMWCPGRW